MKEHRCTTCNKVYASSQSLWNHKQRCNEKVRYKPFQRSLMLSNYEDPNSSQIRVKLDNHSRKILHRLERLEVQNGEIDDIIDGLVEKMKDEIWNCMAEFHEFEERERKGGTVAWDTLNIGRKDEDEWIEKDEDASNEIEESNEKEDESNYIIF